MAFRLFNYLLKQCRNHTLLFWKWLNLLKFHGALAFSSRLIGVKMTITFWGENGGRRQEEPPWKSQELLLWQMDRLRLIHLHLWGNQSIPVEIVKLRWLLILSLVHSYFWTLTYLSPFCHLCQEYTSPTRKLRVFVLWCCWEFAEITWDLSCLPRFYCCPWVPGWLEGVDGPVDRVSSCVILLHCDMWLCLSLPSTSFTQLYDVSN